MTQDPAQHGYQGRERGRQRPSERNECPHEHRGLLRPLCRTRVLLEAPRPTQMIRADRDRHLRLLGEMNARRREWREEGETLQAMVRFFWGNAVECEYALAGLEGRLVNEAGRELTAEGREAIAEYFRACSAELLREVQSVRRMRRQLAESDAELCGLLDWLRGLLAQSRELSAQARQGI